MKQSRQDAPTLPKQRLLRAESRAEASSQAPCRLGSPVHHCAAEGVENDPQVQGT